jgi:cytidyltransferase-like protein
VSDAVLIGGVFDPLHAGHLAYIQAVQHQDFAQIVCAVSDNPAKHPPLVPLAERVELLTALGVHALANPHPTCAPLIRVLKPAFYIKGRDWKGKLPEDEMAACAEVGTVIDYTDTVTQSSSTLLADYQRRLNAEHLEAFERFVQGQTPAEKPWEPVTDYSYEARKDVEGPHAQIIKEAFRPVDVTDVGCGPGYLVKTLRDLGVRAQGVDIQRYPMNVSSVASIGTERGPAIWSSAVKCLNT